MEYINILNAIERWMRKKLQNCNRITQIITEIIEPALLN